MSGIIQYTLRLSKSNHPTDGYLQRNIKNLYFYSIKSFINVDKFPKTALFLGIIELLLPITKMLLPISIPLLLITNPLLTIIISLLLIILSFLLTTILLLLIKGMILVILYLKLINNKLFSGKFILINQLYLTEQIILKSLSVKGFSNYFTIHKN